ncbi:MAG: hypothetical protein WD295_05310 [Bacteroidota bacterium]
MIIMANLTDVVGGVGVEPALLGRIPQIPFATSLKFPYIRPILKGSRESVKGTNLVKWRWRI